MLYSTVDEWKTKYPKLDQTNVASATLSGFLDEASSEADGYLATAGYTVPVTPAPPVLSGKVQALAMVFFYERNVRESGRDSGVERMRNSVYEWFQKLVDGETVLVDADGVDLSGGVIPEVWASTEDYTPTAGAGDISDWVVDNDRLNDEEDAR